MSSLKVQRGFSLVEIMIGLVIGMLSVIIVLQVFARSNAANRITANANDAQVESMMALHLLSREIRQSGLNLGSLNLLGCSLHFKPSKASSSKTVAFGPVSINASEVAAGDSYTDTLLLISGSYGGGSEGDVVTAFSQPSLGVTTAAAHDVGNYLVLGSSSPLSSCQLALYKVQAKAASVLTLSNEADGYTGSASVLAYNLGSRLRIRAYAVRRGSLTECDYLVNDCSSLSGVTDPTIWVPIANQVVSLRAQYARDSSLGTALSSRSVDLYDQVTPGSSADTSTALLACRWVHVMGLRFAVVGRSQHLDRSKPTTGSPTWAGSSGAPIDLSILSDWQGHRYRMLETTVPLRNIVWQGASTCS